MLDRVINSNENINYELAGYPPSIHSLCCNCCDGNCSVSDGGETIVVVAVVAAPPRAVGSSSKSRDICSMVKINCSNSVQILSAGNRCAQPFLCSVLINQNTSLGYRIKVA